MNFYNPGPLKFELELSPIPMPKLKKYRLGDIFQLLAKPYIYDLARKKTTSYYYKFEEYSEYKYPLLQVKSHLRGPGATELTTEYSVQDYRFYGNFLIIPNIYMDESNLHYRVYHVDGQFSLDIGEFRYLDREAPPIQSHEVLKLKENFQTPNTDYDLLATILELQINRFDVRNKIPLSDLIVLLPEMTSK
jgi:hypothetical protein